MKLSPQPRVSLGLVIIANLSLVAPLEAGVWDDLVRSASKASKTLPERIPGADDIAMRLDSHPGSRRVAAKELGDASKLADARAVSHLIDSYLVAPSSDLLKGIERLEPAQFSQVIVLGKGAKRLSDGVGDAATSARFVREGGADLAAAAGLHGDEVVDDAIRLDALLRSDSLTIPAGYRKPTLQDFGRMIVDGGEASWRFYTTYIRPNWKEWAAGGAIVAFLINPEQFYDAAGKLTEVGTELITRTAGEALAGTLRGVGNGSSRARSAIATNFTEHFLNGWASVPAYFGFVVLILVIGFCFRRTRRQLLRPFRWLNRE